MSMDRGKRILKWIQSKITWVKKYTATKQQENSLQKNSDAHCSKEKESVPTPSNYCPSDPSESSQAFNAGKLDSEIPAAIQESGSSHQSLLSNLDKVLPGINNLHQTTGELQKELPQGEEQVEHSSQNKLEMALDGRVRDRNVNLPPISEEYKNSNVKPHTLPEVIITVCNGRKNFAFEVDMGDGVSKPRPTPFHKRKINSSRQLNSKLQQSMEENHKNNLITMQNSFTEDKVTF